MARSKKPLQAKEIGAISEVHNELAVYGDFVLTKKGSLIGAIELQGRDPGGLIAEDLQGLAYIGRALYEELDEGVIATQYYAHYDGATVALRDRDHTISHRLSKSRETFVNKQSLSSSSLVHYFEVLPDESLSQLDKGSLFMHLAKAIVSADSRDIVKRHFSNVESVVCYFEELERQTQVLTNILSDVQKRWDTTLSPRIMSKDEIWAHMKFVSNLEPYYLSDEYKAEAPEGSWDVALPDGDISLMTVRNMDTVKLHNTTPTYARFLTVNRFGANNVPWGFWADRKGAPVRLQGNYLLMTRMHGMSRLQASMMFGARERELNRRALDFRSLMKGETPTELERRELMKPAIKKALEDLGEAEMIDDGWANVHSYIVTWSDDAKTLSDMSVTLKRSADRASLNTCWENAGLSRAFKTLQPAGREHSLRDVVFTTTQYAASSLFYKPCDGQQAVPDLGSPDNPEEALYIFVGDDGTPFYYSPFVNGRAVVIGIGPIRSGKSFLKNTVGSHFTKYGGSIHGIDVDEGMTPVAQSFGQDGSVFELEQGDGVGFNSFAVCRGEGDTGFIQHYKSQIMMMLATNDNDEMKRVTPEEQKSLDRAIRAVINLEPHYRRLSTVVQHCPESLRMKLSRWIHGESDEHHGMYAQYFDSPRDTIGSINQRAVAYNLKAIKDDPILLPLVMAEIFFRVTRLFENPKYRHLAKYLDVDEAHVLLQIPYVQEYIIRNAVRTWGKYLAGVGLWSQSPLEFKDLKHWPAVRSAASTFFFMADPQMDVELYKETFQLTDGECDAIRTLTPKREAFIIQRDLGIAKKVILEVEPQQYVISTSKPSDAVIRRQNIDAYGFEEGIHRTIIDLGLEDEDYVKPTDDDIEEVA